MYVLYTMRHSLSDLTLKKHLLLQWVLWEHKDYRIQSICFILLTCKTIHKAYFAAHQLIINTSFIQTEYLYSFFTRQTLIIIDFSDGFSNAYLLLPQLLKYPLTDVCFFYEQIPININPVHLLSNTSSQLQENKTWKIPAPNPSGDLFLGTQNKSLILQMLLGIVLTSDFNITTYGRKHYGLQ